MADRDDAGHGFASPPCSAHELDPTYAGMAPPDAQERRDVARWRKAARAERLGARKAMSVAEQAGLSTQISDALLVYLEAVFGGAHGRVLSGYWPIKGEPDLRPLMEKLHARGVTVALPVVETKAAPLVFRRWTPETKMVRGDWNIPVPPADSPRVTPDFALAPLVGWDAACFRLGYGGGYFDRTLAAPGPTPIAIGVGYGCARLATIYPQPWDVPLQAIVTEAGVEATRR